MEHAQKRLFLIRYLLCEQGKYAGEDIPEDEDRQRRFLRSLINVRAPAPVSDEFLTVQDEYLKEAIGEKGVTDAADLPPAEDGLFIWQGDITTLRCDAIVNAANSDMTGCYSPCHNCIDNAIHTYAGVQLRLACADIIKKQGRDESAGQAKITPGFNLPCRYIIHTVGPVVEGRLTERHERLLASCYRSCLALAAENGLESIAFCCISTGVFGFPGARAAQIAVETVRQYKRESQSGIKVIFNVFKDKDLKLYRGLVGQH